ncbi:31756_t:CDS:2, partial [Racocetra persica]
QILIRLEYQIELPDHDWVVAERHKLISSVYAILDVHKDKYEQAEAVTYSGSTFIRICSSKHDSSTAYSHGKDFDDLILRTSDEELEKRNFKAAGDVLASVWEDTIINGYQWNQTDPSESLFPTTTSDPTEASNIFPSIGALKIYIKKYKKFNLSKEPVLDIQDNKSSKIMQIDEEAVPEDLLETYPQQVQVQEKLIADRVLIVNWDIWKQCE